jgi:signal transduction histidine kinase
LRPTVRLRLTLLYGGLFLVCGITLLAVTYLLVVHATSGIIFRGENMTAVIDTGPSRSKPSGAASVGTSSIEGSGTAPILAPEVAARLAKAQHAAELHQLLLQSGIALAVVTIIALGLGWMVAGRALRKLRAITTAVQQISATNLHERLALTGPDDELKELGDTFDALVGRLEASFAAQRRFVANASHELRTPLARQRTVGQVALADPDASIESLQAAHERVLAAGAQQEQLIEALLTLARGQAGVDRNEPFDLATLAERVVASRRAEAQYRDIAVYVDVEPAPGSGDPRLVERLVTNLVDNALRHNIVGGCVVVRTTGAADDAVLSVANTGPVVPADALDGLFQPFRRMDADRTGRGLGHGLGLGLSIVQAVADAHNARVDTRAQTHGGLRVEVRFPRTCPPPSPARAGQPTQRSVTNGAS